MSRTEDAVGPEQWKIQTDEDSRLRGIPGGDRVHSAYHGSYQRWMKVVLSQLRIVERSNELTL
ncbi:hypothetical protein MK489_18580 [Myxococcota bacterium]|nr:hypothetical protein [Myxococcota bacterium]